MKMVMIAALVAAQLSAAAAPAQAAEVPNEAPATQQRGSGEGVELSLRDEQEPQLRLAGTPASSRETVQGDEPRKKRKSTGDKVLTGAAIVLGIGALAVGGLLIAVFAN